MTELARKPTAMKKARNEIRSCVAKKRTLTENDVSKLTYLNMIGDFDINPRTRIAVNVWAIGQDPDIWDNPEEFIPERVNDNPIDLKGQHFE
ncbi:hypothetical protein J1N35_015147 [Gossypium stocksii]|uniref:Cytochrome P450 n=1 Tax=Gossypium stocksii TaxID=47602 RepID=A0A9D4AAF5_9ROSI|nr:hypothetical protein J1N35_015147 [Gossypium stocksii]